MDHTTMLTHVLKLHFGWHLARIKCLSCLIVASFKVRWWAGIIAAPLSGLVRVIILIILANIRAGFICLRVLNLSVVIIPTHYPPWHSLGFRYFRVNQGCATALREFFTTSTTAKQANGIAAIDFADPKIALVGFSMQRTFGVDTC
ncbi:hypothetical protein C2W62_19275 [Candidatus Entotheonella serta]|nr:hypothetical protein C2W62_19275 [Candidatus Entotheonella serta]